MLPDLPSPHALVAILLAFGAILLFTREKVPLESSSLLVLLFVLVWFESSTVAHEGARLRAADVVAGFGNEALITISALLVLARGLERTGALQPIGHVLARIWKVRPQAAFLATMLTTAGLSMFLNNTPVVALMLPVLVAVCMQSGIPPSAILMPIGFATIIGGSATTIGTSTNLLVLSVAADLGMPEMQMFDFAMPIFIVGGVAILYLWIMAPRLLPDRRPPLTDTVPRIFDSRLRIEEGSYADGKRLSELLAHTGGMKVSKITRSDLALVKLPFASIKAGDLLHVSDAPEKLKEYERLLGATLLPGHSDVRDANTPVRSTEQLAEIVVTRGSALAVTGQRFDQRVFDVIAVRRPRHELRIRRMQPRFPEPGLEALGRIGEQAHGARPRVQYVFVHVGAVSDATAEPRPCLDQRHAQGPPAAPNEVNGESRSAEASADDHDVVWIRHGVLLTR